MSTERLAAAIQFFFETALPEATGKRLPDLADAAVHVGGYERYTGAALTTRLGQAITPQYVLKVGKQPLQVAGGAPPLTSCPVLGRLVDKCRNDVLDDRAASRATCRTGDA